MSRKIDSAVQALKRFIKNVHCDGKDRCIAATFSNRLIVRQMLAYSSEEASRCIDNLDTHGGTRLYDSVCNLVDLFCQHGDRSRPWIIVAVTHRNDNRSNRSAMECNKYISENYKNKNGCYIFLISVGDSTKYEELDIMSEQDSVYHINIVSFERLGRVLASIAHLMVSSVQSPTLDSLGFEAEAGRPSSVANLSAIDYAVAISNSSSMGENVAVGQELEHSHGSSPIPKRAQSNTGKMRTRVRELHNSTLHPNDRQIFRDFVDHNYPGIDHTWSEGDIEFLVLVDSSTRCLVGLLVMAPYGSDNIHISFIAVDTDYRKQDIEIRLLTHAAAKYVDRKITLNVPSNRPDLIHFYSSKEYMKQESIPPPFLPLPHPFWDKGKRSLPQKRGHQFGDKGRERQTVTFSLINVDLFARIPLPRA